MKYSPSIGRYIVNVKSSEDFVNFRGLQRKYELYKHMKNSAVCLLWKHKNKTKVCYLLTKKDQEKTLPVERDKACFVARVTYL